MRVSRILNAATIVSGTLRAACGGGEFTASGNAGSPDNGAGLGGAGGTAGTAGAPSDAPMAECDNQPATLCETDPSSSPSNCGSCNHKCSDNHTPQPAPAASA